MNDVERAFDRIGHALVGYGIEPHPAFGNALLIHAVLMLKQTGAVPSTIDVIYQQVKDAAFKDEKPALYDADGRLV